MMMPETMAVMAPLRPLGRSTMRTAPSRVRVTVSSLFAGSRTRPRLRGLA